MNQSGSLWHNRAFTRLWVAHVTSGAGTAITTVALPLTAVIVLGATPSEMGLLAAAGSLPNLLFGFVAGVWVDRVRRRPILVWADIGRALLLVSIPVAAWMGQLTFSQIWIVTFAAGTLTVFFQIGAISLLPALVEKRELVAANSRLSTSDAVLSIAGPAAAGGLVQLFSAPKAILIDAVSYLFSALALSGVTEDEPNSAAPPDADDAKGPKEQFRSAVVAVGQEVGEGVLELLRTPLLRTLTITSSMGMLAGSMSAAVQMLFLVDQLNFTPSVIGTVLACGGAGSLLGALLSGRVAKILQVGMTLVVGKLLWIAGTLLLASADLIGYDDRRRGRGACFERFGQHHILRQSDQLAPDYNVHTATGARDRSQALCTVWSGNDRRVYWRRSGRDCGTSGNSSGRLGSPYDGTDTATFLRGQAS